MKLPPPTIRTCMSCHPRAAVHIDGDASHIPALLASEEGDNICQVIHVRQTTERRCSKHCLSLALSHCVPMLLQQWAADCERRDEAVHVYTMWPELLRQMASQPNNAQLGTDVSSSY